LTHGHIAFQQSEAFWSPGLITVPDIRLDMTRRVHRVMQDPKNFNCAVLDAPIQDEMTASPTTSCDVQTPYTGLDLVTRHAVRELRAVPKRRERCHNSPAMDQRLSRSECGDCPLDDGNKVALSRCGNTNAPTRLGQV
jgi:hypothetical protein